MNFTNDLFRHGQPLSSTWESTWLVESSRNAQSFFGTAVDGEEGRPKSCRIDSFPWAGSGARISCRINGVKGGTIKLKKDPTYPLQFGWGLDGGSWEDM